MIISAGSMLFSHIRTIVLIARLLTFGAADYECLCNYDVEKQVYPSKSTQPSYIGYLYEFDCKATYGSTSEAQWQAIQYENQVRR